MASSNAGYTTGAGRDEAELRRRNVVSYESTNGQQIYKVEAEDRKKLKKVGTHSLSRLTQILIMTARERHPRYAGRVGIHHRPCHLHALCPSHETLEDRIVTHSDLG